MVLGDLMLDRYLWGQVSRISPEAPVPVVEIEEEYSRLGGAANVGNNIAALGAVPYLVGLVGDDNSGRELQELIATQGLPTHGIVVDRERPTTVKTRVIAHNQHVVRTDRENRAKLSDEMCRRVQSVIVELLPQIDAVIIEDYNKGLITEDVIQFVIAAAKAQGKVVTVDPKFDHFFDFRQATIFKPNRHEAEAALGMRLRTQEQLIEAAHVLFERLRCNCLLITLGEAGMAVFTNRAQEVQFIPTHARKVHDVSGAGDTVISMATLALLADASFIEASTLANYAAGIVCGEVGIVPITPELLLEGMFAEPE